VDSGAVLLPAYPAPHELPIATFRSAHPCSQLPTQLAGQADLNSKQWPAGMPDSSPSLNPLQLGAYVDLVEVTSLLRHAVQQLREAGDLS